MGDTLTIPTRGEPVEITTGDFKNLLVRNWLTHDATWCAGTVDELGIETANRLNRRAVAGMSGVEAARLLSVIGLERVSTAEERHNHRSATLTDCG